MRVRNRRVAQSVAAAAGGDPRLGRLAEWGRRLAGLGVAPGASGNLSCRTESGFLITRTGAELGGIVPDDWVEVVGLSRSDKGTLTVSYRGAHEPSRDAFVHGTVYDRQPGAAAIFHLHDRLVLERGAGLPITERFYPAGTVESVEEIERLLRRRPAAHYFLLAGHGVVAWEATVDATGALIEAEHEAARRRHG